MVALGGGHGLASTLRAVRRYAGRLTAVVSVADDGGSSGRLRQSVGIPAPGDLRRCLVALADPESPWAQAFEHRFSAGDLKGHPLGNLIIAGLADFSGDFTEALRQSARLLGVSAQVLPATSGPVVLRADVAGREVVGQVNVAEATGRITSVALVPPDPSVPEEVVAALEEADQVVMGPGSLFTSVLAVGAVPEIRSALRRRVGGRVFVCNLRPQPPETAGFAAVDHLGAIVDHGVPVDVMVVDAGYAAGLPPTGLPPTGPTGVDGLGVAGVGEPGRAVRILTAPLARPDRSGHDPVLLAAVLAQLAGGSAERPERPERTATHKLDRSGRIG